jgi:hypothetical protein
MRVLRLGWIGLAAAAACGSGDLVANAGFEIECDGLPCDWTVVEGEPALFSGWIPGDPGVDLSSPGRAVVEQRAAPFTLTQRELTLRAAIARDPGVKLRFELDWYVAGKAPGVTYWDREPVLIASRGFDVDRSGTFALAHLVSTPSNEVSGVVIRLIKEGSGTAIVDEVHLAPEDLRP